MKAKLTSSNRSYKFEVKIGKKMYLTTIYVNEKGKFIDDEIEFRDGVIFDSVIVTKKVREKILEYLDKNWDNLVNSAW